MLQMMDGKIIIKRHTCQKYTTYFDQNSGLFVRKEDKDTEEPFWSEDGPELLDVSITNYCERACEFCYRHSEKNGKHISKSDFQIIIEQAAELGVLQIALGGGNPNQHPQFIEFLKLVREHNIIPSYTTNGDGLSPDILKASADYCGAMAISVYSTKEQHIAETLERINNYAIKTNLHLILKADTIDYATEWLLNPPVFFKYVNAIIFLNYKPINRQLELSVNDISKIERFFRIASECKNVKIGFDSCCVSGIVKWMKAYPFFVESCEAARFSAFISEEMKMYPCSFMANTTNYGDLRKQSIIEIWKSNNAFVNHRYSISHNFCKSCDFNEICNGGCRYMPQINFCNNDGITYNKL